MAQQAPLRNRKPYNLLKDEHRVLALRSLKEKQAAKRTGSAQTGEQRIAELRRGLANRTLSDKAARLIALALRDMMRG